jgi:hypothetical protein
MGAANTLLTKPASRTGLKILIKAILTIAFLSSLACPVVHLFPTMPTMITHHSGGIIINLFESKAITFTGSFNGLGFGGIASLAR